LDRPLANTSLLEAMATDKKNRDERIQFALPSRLGAMHRAHGWTTPVPTEAITAAISVLS
jgi:3-dehydroquinate synthetase